VDPALVSALRYVAQNSEFTRAWRPADDYGRILDQVFDVPRGKKDELTDVLINSHLSHDPCFSPFVDFDIVGLCVNCGISVLLSKKMSDAIILFCIPKMVIWSILHRTKVS
jgi:hypothetical protein